MDNLFVNVPIVLGGTAALGTTNVFAFHAPADGKGGGITVQKVNFYSKDAVAAASAPSFELVTLGTNSAINGTICAATGSSAFTAGTAKAATISNAWVDGDYRVAVKWIQTAVNADQLYCNAGISYVMGK